MASFLSDMLAHPLTRGLSLDDPRTTELRARIIGEKGFLRQIYAAWYRLLLEAVPHGDGAILEIGCGGGFLKEVRPDIIASEVFPTPGADIVLDGRLLPFAANSLKAVLMVDVLHHVPEPAAFLREACRCVRPGGACLMVEPWNNGWARWVYRHLHHEPFEPQGGWTIPSSGPLSVFLRGERWRVVMGRPIPRGSAYRATAVGFFFNYVYPARAGDVIKVLSLHRTTGQSLARVGGSAVIVRLIDVLVLLGSTTAVFWLAPELVLGKTLFYAASGGLIAAVILVFSPIGEKLLRRSGVYLDSHPARPMTTTLHRFAGRFLNFRAELLGGHQQWALMAASTLVAATDYLSVFFLLKTFGWHLPLLAPVAVWAIVSLGAALPSAPAGLGVHQLACILALGIFRVPAADAFGFSLTFQVASFAAILLSLLFGFGVRLSRRSARRKNGLAAK